MIGYLAGVVKSCNLESCLLVCQGVGYEIMINGKTSACTMGQSEMSFFIHHHIREDAQLLFGFETEKERELFESLISVSGIGPKVAINILSSISISDLVSAIQTENIMIITQCPGIGKKTAERMVIELKDKVQGLAGAPKVIEKTTETVSSHDSDDIVLALRQLGYQKDEIKRGFMKHAKELSTVTSIEDQIKILLKYL